MSELSSNAGEREPAFRAVVTDAVTKLSDTVNYTNGQQEEPGFHPELQHPKSTTSQANTLSAQLVCGNCNVFLVGC